MERVYLRKGLQGELYLELFQLIRDGGIPYQFVPPEKLNRISRKNHQGVIAITSVVGYQPVEEVVTRLFELGLDPFLVVLDQVTDVRNLGAIARSAEAAGAHVLLIPERGSAQINEDAIKTSAGALNLIQVCRSRDLVKTIGFLKESGLAIVGASEKADDSYFARSMKGPIALVMGSEEHGISREIEKLCSHLVRIPMVGKVGSLNVSVAAGILLFEISRQRNG